MSVTYRVGYSGLEVLPLIKRTAKTVTFRDGKYVRTEHIHGSSHSHFSTWDEAASHARKEQAESIDHLQRRIVEREERLAAIGKWSPGADGTYR